MTSVHGAVTEEYTRCPRTGAITGIRVTWVFTQSPGVTEYRSPSFQVLTEVPHD